MLLKYSKFDILHSINFPPHSGELGARGSSRCTIKNLFFPARNVNNQVCSVF